MIDRGELEDLANQAVTHADDSHDVCLYQLWDTIDEMPDEDLIQLIREVDPSLLNLINTDSINASSINT